MKCVFAALLISGCFITGSPARAGTFESDVRNLGDKDFAVRSAAYARLENAAADAIPDIINGADKDTNPSVRAQCVRLIYLIRDPRAYDVTKKIALTESEWETRKMAVDALPRLKNPDAAALLEKIAKEDTLPNIRVAAISKLANVSGAAAKPFLKTLLTDSNLLIQLTAAFELARMGEKMGYALAKSALNNKGMTVKMTAISVIAYSGTSADTELLKAIAENRRELRPVQNSATHAIQHLKIAQLSETAQLTALRDAMSNPTQTIRVWAAKELLQRNDAAALGILVDIEKQAGHVGQAEATRALQSHSDK